MDQGVPKRFVVNREILVENFPTHLHASGFWEELGRAVATFGFLEETLGKAIFSFAGMREISQEEYQAELAAWFDTLNHALSDTLGALIDRYGAAVRAHGHATVTNLDVLLDALRDASRLRNVICHGSWRRPDIDGKSLPLFVNKRGEIFETAIDIAFLRQLRQEASRLICEVVNTVTHMGWQFPGSDGPGKPVWTKANSLRSS